MKVLSLLLLTTVAGLASSVGHAPSNFFPETSILECMVPNPRRGERDQPDTKVEEIPVIPFHVVYTVNGSWFQPLQSGFRSPVSGEFNFRVRDVLLEFVRDELNLQLSFIGAEEPSSSPEIPEAPAGGIIPQRIRLEGNGIGPIVETTQNHTDEVEERLDELGVLDPATRQAVINAHLALNLNCSVYALWTRLPKGHFFPEWIYASYCSGDTCSLPGGLTCEPVVKAEAIAHTRFLRWDCCWSLIRRRYVWQCGWRKVYIAYIGRCDCSCGVQFYDSDYKYEAGVGEPSYLTRI